MTIRLEGSEKELLRPLRACFPAVILTIARTGKSGMIWLERSKKRASRFPRSQFHSSGLRVRITEFEIKLLFYVFGIPASVFRIRVSAFDCQNLGFRIRNPRSQFEFSRSSSFSAWLLTGRATYNTISRDGRSAGVVSFGVPAYNRSGRSPRRSLRNTRKAMATQLVG